MRAPFVAASLTPVTTDLSDVVAALHAVGDHAGAAAVLANAEHA